MSAPDSTVPYGYCHCGCGQRTKLSTRTNPSRGTAKGEPQRFVFGHQNGQPPVPPEQNYRLEDRGYTTPCWIWGGSVDALGYGHYRVGRSNTPAHRIVYQRIRGEIPNGLELDHLCRVTSCVNPEHLEAVSHAENMRRASNTKLNRAIVREIRGLYATGSHSQPDIARRFGLSPGHVSQIIRGHAWSEDGA